MFVFLAFLIRPFMSSSFPGEHTPISSGAAHRCMDISGLVGSSLQAGCLSGCPVRCEPRDTATVTAKVVDVFTKDGSFAN